MNTLTILSNGNTAILMLYINILLLIVGCVMDLTPALLIMAMMLLPVVLMYHINPVYFGVVMVVNLCIGILTPPVDTVLFIGCSVSKISMEKLAQQYGLILRLW